MTEQERLQDWQKNGITHRNLDLNKILFELDGDEMTDAEFELSMRVMDIRHNSDLKELGRFHPYHTGSFESLARKSLTKKEKDEILGDH